MLFLGFDFIDLRWLDLIDIVLVAALMYQLYQIIRGTAALRIFLGIFTLFLLWKLVQNLNMALLTEILGQFISVGMIALIIVFQQEIRRFLLLVGSTSIVTNSKWMGGFVRWMQRNDGRVNLSIEAIALACEHLSKTKTGALIVIEKGTSLTSYLTTGLTINADLSSDLLEQIFFKNSPLHDGAVIIVDNKIAAARCLLPISERKNLPGYYGLRHRAAIGLSENSDAMVIIVSEESSKISVVQRGEISEGVDGIFLRRMLSSDKREEAPAVL